MASRKLFHDSVVEPPPQADTAPTELNAASAEHGEELMTVSFSLSGDEAKNDELEARVERREALRSWLRGELIVLARLQSIEASPALGSRVNCHDAGGRCLVRRAPAQ